MKIASIQAFPLFASFADMFGGAQNVPASLLAPANHFRLVPRTGQHSTVVVIRSDAGRTGIGEAWGLPHAQPTASLIEDVLAPALVGQNLNETDALPSALLAPLYSFFVALGHTRGPSMEALSGIDIALWDLLAKEAERPLGVHLGGQLAPVPTYVSPVPYLDTPDESARAAQAFEQQGFSGIKLKVGRGLAVDMAHIEAVRSALTSTCKLMLDVNCAYAEDTAIALALALKPMDIAWLEEPIRPDSPDALAQVRRKAPMPIACGENEFAYGSFEALAQAGAVDILQPNITRAGGVSGLRAIDSLCLKHGIALSPHGVGSAIGVAAAVHVACAAQSFSVYEANLLPNALRSELALMPLALVNGHYIPGTRPGHGCEPNPEVMARFDIRRNPMNSRGKPVVAGANPPGAATQGAA
jgi:D-galactarolactone cycloisomerase